MHYTVFTAHVQPQKRLPLISAVGPIGKAEGNYSQSAHFLRFLAMFDSSFIHDAAQQNETQLARTRGRCGFTTWNHLKSTWRGKSYFRRKHSPLIDLTVLWITAVRNMAFKGHISSSLQRSLITVIVGEAQSQSFCDKGRTKQRFTVKLWQVLNGLWLH